MHYPIALLMVGVLIEVFSFLGWRRGGFRQAGRWMILLGAITMLPTALNGMYALNEVVKTAIPDRMDDMSWRTALSQSALVRDPIAWEHMSDHAWIQSIASVIVLFVVVVWIGASDRMRSTLHVPLVLILLFGCALVGAGAWHAGEGVYQHGVAVRSERERGDATPASAKPATTQPQDDGPNDEHATSSSSRMNAIDRATAKVNYFVPPLEGHLIMAGFTVSLALVSLGLAVRGAGAPPVKVDGVHDIAAALAPFDTAAADDRYDRRDVHASIDRSEARRRFPGSLPPARFWMLTMLFGVITALLGVYFFGIEMHTWNPRELMNGIYDPSLTTPITANRRLVHVVVGVSIVVLTLLLAAFGRWAPRRKVVVFVLGLLLLASLSAQAWLGGLLLFDGANGNVTRLN